MSITHHLSFNRTAMATLLATTLTAGLIGCSSDEANTTTSISGSVFASSVRGANCEIQDNLGDKVKGPFVTTSAGTYSVALPNASLKEDLMLVCTGGGYTDEATGTDNITAGTMAAYVAGGTLGHGSSVHATPGSTIIYHIVTAPSGGSLADALDDFTGAFGYTPDTSIAPTDATDPDVDATDEELLAGLRAAAFSQLTEDMMLDPADQFALLEALADDLADSTLNGLKGGGSGSGGSPEPVEIGTTGTYLPVDIQNRFTTALLNFHDDPANDTDTAGDDATGLTTDKIGTLPFGKTALTTSYKVEYVYESQMDNPMQGKTEFQISLTDLSNDLPAEGVAVMLMPMMNMATKQHSTPVDGNCLPGSGAEGVYDCTVYYVMATAMGGYWDLKVMSNGEEAHFYPEVMMVMPPPMAVLKNSNLTSTMMSVTSVRPFQAFKSSLTGTTGDHDFELYTATMESMMSFPAVYDGVTLNVDDVTNELLISSMEVLVSTDPTFVLDTVTATDEGNGYWTAAGITSLTNSVEATLYVQMTINGHVLNSSIDGVAGDGINNYATFTVTPTMAIP